MLMVWFAGCTIGDDTETKGTDDTSDTSIDTDDTDNGKLPPIADMVACDNLGEIDFGACENELGWAVVGSSCVSFKGCDTRSIEFYTTTDECLSACFADVGLCEATNGFWIETTKGGEYICGQPACSKQECDPPYGAA